MSALTKEPKKITVSSKATSLSQNLRQRWLTALAFGPLILMLMGMGGWWFFAVALALAVIGALEFCNLGRNRQIKGHALLAVAATVVIVLAFVLKWMWVVVAALLITFCMALLWSLVTRRAPRAALLDALMTIAAPAYAAIPAGMLAQVRLIEPGGLHWLLLIVFLTWGTDTLAYFGGRTWGKTLLAPRISPKKTLEGAIVGVSGGFVVGLVLMLIAGAYQPALLPVLVLAPLVAVIGDLSESALKRTFDVKDSHLSHFDLFPGHGGVLDRTDALILVTWFCYIVYHLIGILT